LSRVYEVQQLAISELPPFYQEQVKAKIDVSGLDSARATIAELNEAAKRCAPATKVAPRRSPSAGAKSSPTPSNKPAGKPTQETSAPATEQVEPSC
jgi:hypothetical protein